MTIKQKNVNANKKKKKGVVILAFIILFLLIIVSVFAFVISNQVGGMRTKTDKITVHSLFHHNVDFLELHLRCYLDGNTTPAANKIFTLAHKETSIQDVFENVRNAQTNIPIFVELIRERYIVISTNFPGLRYAMIVCWSVHGGGLQGQAFDFMPMQGGFFYQDVFTVGFQEIEGENYVTYIPYHLFDDNLLFYLDFLPDRNTDIGRNRNLLHQAEHFYKIYGDMADFREFYESVNLYEITEVDNELILTGQIHKRMSSNVTADVLTVNGRIILTFKEENGQNFVAYSFEMV